MVAEGCDTFSTIYRKITSKYKKIDEVTFGIERQTYGEIIVERLGMDKSDRVIRSARKDFFTSFHKNNSLDIILSYFPGDLFLQTDLNYAEIGDGYKF
ncbi:hypothetical protein [Chamaesiphon sp. OTE_20_metabat_361]|uniref:hypothetical protein n=1 Tax=Chamaesiphon sp. OTE_20_metabat_361 TaxID=2964689 RepID=UPI00286CB870|nr:hypothetical protein [Chamaesiphon sp. OTE_20_metabat_361]